MIDDRVHKQRAPITLVITNSWHPFSSPTNNPPLIRIFVKTYTRKDLFSPTDKSKQPYHKIEFHPKMLYDLHSQTGSNKS